MKQREMYQACDLASSIINTYLPTPIHCLAAPMEPKDKWGDFWGVSCWFKQTGLEETEDFATLNMFPLETTQSVNQVAHEIIGTFLHNWREHQLNSNESTVCL